MQLCGLKPHSRDTRGQESHHWFSFPSPLPLDVVTFAPGQGKHASGRSFNRHPGQCVVALPFVCVSTIRGDSVWA